MTENEVPTEETQRGQHEIAEETGEATEIQEPLRREHTHIGVPVNQTRFTNPDYQLPPEERAKRQAQVFESTFAVNDNESKSVEEEGELKQASGPPLAKADSTNDPQNQIQGPGGINYTNIHERRLPGVAAGMPGTRTGQPLQMVAESMIGSKVWDIQNDGSVILKVQSKDHTRAIRYDGIEPQGAPEVQKLKVSFWFPAISPSVAQRQLIIQVSNNNPTVMLMPPDQANVEVLVTPDVPVHAELTHINQQGVQNQPWIVDFFSNPRSSPRPLGASALTFRMLERVTVTGELAQWSGNQDHDVSGIQTENQAKREGNPPTSDSPSRQHANEVSQNPDPNAIKAEQNLSEQDTTQREEVQEQVLNAE